jgi:hypothetical protein
MEGVQSSLITDYTLKVSSRRITLAMELIYIIALDNWN